MKNILFSLAVLCTLGQAKAQSVKFGVKAGINLSEMTNTSLNLYQPASVFQKRETSSVSNFHFGGFADIRFKNFSIQPGLTYITKGGINDFSYKDNSTSYQSNEKLNLHYLELPVNLLINLPAGPGEVFFGGGPYLDFGLSGKATDNYTALGRTTTINYDVAFGNVPSADYQDSFQSGEVRKTAFGVNALAGYKLNNGLLISAGYGFNLTQIANNKDQTAKLNTAVVSVGYCFR